MTLYVELDATASNGEQYWYDQYTVGEPRIAAVVSAQNSTLICGPYVATLSSSVFSASSSMFSNPEVLLTPVASVVEANSIFINNGNFTSSSGVIQFPNSETVVAGVRYIDPCAAVQYGTVTVIVNGRIKWEIENINSENWTKLSINSETWNKVIN